KMTNAPIKETYFITALLRSKCEYPITGFGAIKHLFISRQYNSSRYRLSNPILLAIITFELRERVLHILIRCGIRTGVGRN
ncbi:MAG: hypothetical protein ACYS6K_29400, partial [Planctomycetota bacterium]